MDPIYTIDASGKSLGRVATEAAIHLRGKDKASFKPNIALKANVEIINVDKLNIPAKKMKSKIYTHYTGYPSGLRHSSMEKMISAHGVQEIMKKAVYGMLPNNKLRSVLMKNLAIKKSDER